MTCHQRIFSALSITVIVVCGDVTAQTLSPAGTVPLFAGRHLIAQIPVGDPAASWLGDPSTVDSERSLLIRDLGVVEDPGRTCDPTIRVACPLGPWTLGYLLTQIANEEETGIAPVEFARRWLSSWADVQYVNGQALASDNNSNLDVVAIWRSLSPGGQLDLSRLPFRLLAIVNRIDQRDPSIPGHAGEARFAFGAIAANGAALPFTIVLEYRIERGDHAGTVAWAARWAELKAFIPGTDHYNGRLQTLTDDFTRKGAGPDRPLNRSALAQARTLRFVLALGDYELREFTLDPVSGLLRPSVVTQTPAFTLKTSPLITTWVTKTVGVADSLFRPVPNEFQGQPFAGAVARVEYPGGHWRPPGLASLPRHLFALSTCDGCHYRETTTGSAAAFAFSHIKPRAARSVSDLSGFLTGTEIEDPDGRHRYRFYDLLRRAQDLDALLGSRSMARARPLTAH